MELLDTKEKINISNINEMNLEKLKKILTDTNIKNGKWKFIE